jgi:hypothetical protein
MLKLNFRIAIAFLLMMIYALFAKNSFSEELSGRAADGTPFMVKFQAAPTTGNPNGFWGEINISYKSGHQVGPNVYTVPVQAPPIVRKNGFGLLTIAENIGGMNGTYKVTYLLPCRDGLIIIGGVELSRDNGRYVDVSRVSPVWAKHADHFQLKELADAIMADKENIVVADKGRSIDNAVLVFVVEDIVRDEQKSNPTSLVDLSRRVNDEVDSSIANLIRRRLIGGGISLCDEGQFDVFVCRIGEKSVSVCSGVQGESSVLQYRVGSGRNIELSLAQSGTAGGSMKNSSASFKNGSYQYTVQYGDSDWRGVIINKNNAIVSKIQCAPWGMEPYLLPKN